jgi:arsenate reductase
MVPPGFGTGGIRRGRPRLGGRAAAPLAPLATSPVVVSNKKRVLFVCIGNSCRSQMAEVFARAYGSDVIDQHSAGISPASTIAPLTTVTLAEKNLRLNEQQYPKGLDVFSPERFDIVVNMSGANLEFDGPSIIEWTVPDPIGQRREVFRGVAEKIETLVMRLILELRSPPR